MTDRLDHRHELPPRPEPSPLPAAILDLGFSFERQPAHVWTVCTGDGIAWGELRWFPAEGEWRLYGLFDLRGRVAGWGWLGEPGDLPGPEPDGQLRREAVAALAEWALDRLVAKAAEAKESSW